MDKCVLSGFFRCDKEPWIPRVWIWSSADVDFANPSSISDSKCYPDLEPTGRTESNKRLTLFLSELPLQIPVAPWGCQNKLNALYTKSWGHFLFNLNLSCCWEYLHPPWDLGSHSLASQNICSRMSHHWEELRDLLCLLHPSLPPRGQENIPGLKVPNAVSVLT